MHFNMYRKYREKRDEKHIALRGEKLSKSWSVFCKETYQALLALTGETSCEDQYECTIMKMCA